MKRSNRTDLLAQGLGWFSIGIGLAEIGAPRGVGRLIGLDADRRRRKLMLALGLREIATGVGILSGRRRAGWMWSRVAGDAMDLALLGSAMSAERTDRMRLAAASAAVAGVTVVDVVAAARAARAATLPGSAAQGIHVVKSMTIARTPKELYRFWRDLENLPRFMEHLESVQVMGDRSHWQVKGPAGSTIEWDAEIVEDRPDSFIAWRSLPGADVSNAGRVEFTPAPGGRGTEVKVELHYDPPAGVVGKTIAKLFGREPAQQVAGDLHRFKQVIETGEVVRSDASIHRGMHAAQPPRRGRELPRPVYLEGQEGALR